MRKPDFSNLRTLRLDKVTWSSTCCFKSGVEDGNKLGVGGGNESEVDVANGSEVDGANVLCATFLQSSISNELGSLRLLNPNLVSCRLS